MADAKVEFQFFMSYEDWHKVRDEVPGRFPTDNLPSMELSDGTIVPESGALKRTVAAATGRLGKGRDYAISESLMGISDDLKKLVNTNAPNVANMGLMGGGPRSYTEEQASKCVEETRPKIVAALAKIGRMLIGEGKDRFTSTGETCGEVDLLWTLTMVETVHPGILGPLAAFHARLVAHPGIARYIAGTGTYSTPQTPTWVVPLPA
jgi:hypothetical protein